MRSALVPVKANDLSPIFTTPFVECAAWIAPPALFGTWPGVPLSRVLRTPFYAKVFSFFALFSAILSARNV